MQKNLKIAFIVGSAAVGAASLQAQFVPGLTPLELSKPWSFSGDFRGFYDDNYLTQPQSTPIGNGHFSHPLASWGADLSPSATVNHSAENTMVSASYLFDARWYENHSTMDLTHQFNGRLEHDFGDRYKLSFNESFVDAQEPTVIDPGIVTTPFRLEGDNKRNTGNADFTAGLGRDFDLHLGYANTLYAYQQTARSVIGYDENFSGGPYLATPSQSAKADRMEQLATADLRWKATPETTAILGYEFGHTDYTSPEWVIFPSGLEGLPSFNNGTFGRNAGYRSDIRNSDSHYAYLGVEESFTPELKVSLLAGTEYLDYYNSQTTRLSPYIDANVTYQYLPGDKAQLGVKHVHNATDFVGVAGTTPVLDEETTAVFLSETHNFSSKFTATVTGQAQDSTFVGGEPVYNGKGEDFFVAQVNFAYSFTPWLLAETGYNYSRLTSGVALREYTRNFGYVGVRTTWGP